jgi:hypothetical protein
VEELQSPLIAEVVNTARSNRRYAYVIGAGIALFPIHNKWLTDITSINGMATAFLPALATVVWILATLFFLRDNWKTMDLGPRRIWIPLLTITAAIGLSGVTDDTWSGKLAPLGMGITLFATYLVARTLGKDIILPLAVGAAVASLGIIISSILHPGVPTGGIIFERNFDIATGYILLGTALFIHRHQWVLVGLTVLSLALSGAPEAVFAVGVVFLVVLLRRDWSRRLLWAVTPVVVVIVVGLLAGWTQSLYNYTTNTINNAPMAKYTETQTVSPLEIRWLVIRDAIQNLKPLGDGYNLTGFTVKTVHNVPLIVVQQLGIPGILASMAWLWVTIWCLVKTKWKYAFVSILALSIFDHYLWTQLCPLWPIVVGVATASTVKSDLLFRQS